MVSARQPSSPVSLPVSQSLSLQLTGPDASSLSVSSHRTSLVSPTRSVTVQTSVVTGQTSVVIGQTSTVTGQTSIITGQTSAVTVQTSVVTGQTSTVSGQTNTVTVQTSAVTGQSNTVTGQTSTVNGQTSTVSGQTSTVAVQTSIVAGQTSIVSGQSSTVTDQANTVSGQTSTIDVSPTRTSPGISASVPTGKLISHFFLSRNLFVTQRIPPQVPEDSNFTDRLVLLKFDFNAIMRSSYLEIVLGTQLFYNFFLLPGQFGFLSLFFVFGSSSFDFVMTVFHNVKILCRC